MDKERVCVCVCAITCRSIAHCPTLLCMSPAPLQSCVVATTSSWSCRQTETHLFYICSNLVRPHSRRHASLCSSLWPLHRTSMIHHVHIRKRKRSSDVYSKVSSGGGYKMGRESKRGKEREKNEKGPNKQRKRLAQRGQICCGCVCFDDCVICGCR